MKDDTSLLIIIRFHCESKNNTTTMVRKLMKFLVKTLEGRIQEAFSQITLDWFFESSFLSFCVFTRNLYNLRTIELTKDEYSVFHCKQKNCCKKTNLIMHQPDDCFFSFPYIKFNCAQILQLWRNSFCFSSQSSSSF